MKFPDPPTIVLEDNGQLMATWRNIVVCVFGSTVLSEAGARAQVAVSEAHGRLCGPKQMLEIALIDGETPLPSPGARAVLDAAVSSVGPYYMGVASVFEGTGFRAAVVRGVLTSLSLVSRSSFPQKIFASQADCAAWCATLLSKGRTADAIDVAELTAHVRGIAVERGVVSY